jgi:Flp pilus assembly pilin Flp
MPPGGVASKRSVCGIKTNDKRVNNMLKHLSAFLRDEEGLTMVEYAVAGGLITLGAVTAFTSLGGKVAGVIQWISDQLPTH